PEEHMELIEQNKELYIQGSPLRKAVEKFLGMQESREDIIRMEEGGSSLPDVVPKGNIGSNPTTSRASEVHEEQPDLGENNENMNCDVGDQLVFRSEVYIVLKNNYDNKFNSNDNPDRTDLVPDLQNNQMSGGEPGSLNLEGNVGSNPTSNSGASEVHEEQPDLGENSENMDRDAGNQPRCITEMRLKPGTDMPPIYTTTLYIKLRKNPEFIKCTEDLEGVVVKDDSSANCGSFPAPTTSRNTRPPGS
ncbi:MAG: hypothetical protein LKM45_07565, partial [Wolbachia endosymbiont of Alcedoecus sp.]|nr:hypothetical protein [Wolbachia endosymbiont of Alcedoecus sp.]